MFSDFYEFLLINAKAAAKINLNVNPVFPVPLALVVSCIVFII